MAPHSRFLPEKPHGWRSLAGYSPWGCKESDTTERLHSLLVCICQSQSLNLFSYPMVTTSFICYFNSFTIYSVVLVSLSFIYLFLVARGLHPHCCAWAFSNGGYEGYSLVVVFGLLIVVASLTEELRLQAHRLQQLRRMGSVVAAHGVSCSTACDIFLDQGLNPCPLHWQADCYPLRHQGSPRSLIFTSKTLFLFCK